MRRWVYTQGGIPLPEPIEVGADAPDEVLGIQRNTGDGGKFQYDNVRTLDGVDISSRTKLNRHLKETGNALAHEFKGEWERAAKEREAFARGERSDAQKRAHREALGRAAYRKGLIKY